MRILKPLTVFVAVILSIFTHAQSTDWSATSTPLGGRYDDIYFLNDSVGWATNANGRILHTRNAGATWEIQFSSSRYLRSIEFATPRLGFCGSLDSALLKTEDGGMTWTDIAPTIHPRPAGICGISAPDPLNIYACGIWRSPAFIIKSTDGGLTWTYKDMSAVATRLIDIFFLNKDTGFATGTANPGTDGGILLYTTDGGANWQVKFKTFAADDMVWKIQTPDSAYFFASVQGTPAHPARIWRSDKNGLNWSSVQITPTYADIQMVGFIDRMTGWAGGWDGLYKTTDGGNTWTNNIAKPGSGIGSFNRFFRLNQKIAYLSGNYVFKLNAGGQTPPPGPLPSEHTITVMPNPVKGISTMVVDFANPTFADLTLYSSEGKALLRFLHENVKEGRRTFRLNLTTYPGGTYFLVLRSNEPTMYLKVVK